MMGLFKRGKVWWMSFSWRGRQIRRSTETKDKKLAEKIYMKVLTEVTEGRWFERPKGENITFREMIQKYLEEYSPKKREKTHIRDRSLARHLTDYFGEFTLLEISPKDIYAYKIKRRNEGAAPKTINNELALMSHSFNLARREWEWVSENPVNMVSREKVNNLIERWLTPEEAERLINLSPEWLRDIIVFALNTGLRQGEILNLKWENVDLFRKTITILEQKNKGKDTLPLNSKALEVLTKRAKVRYLKCNYVFLSKAKTKLCARNLIRAFKNACKEAGIENFRFHDLRHTCFTWMAQAGVDLYRIQKLGRWKSISMVQRYAHHYPESLRSGVDALDTFSERFYHNFSTVEENESKG